MYACHCFPFVVFLLDIALSVLLQFMTMTLWYLQTFLKTSRYVYTYILSQKCTFSILHLFTTRHANIVTIPRGAIRSRKSKDTKYNIRKNINKKNNGQKKKNEKTMINRTQHRTKYWVKQNPHNLGVKSGALDVYRYIHKTFHV